jgi:hypothetical protein
VVKAVHPSRIEIMMPAIIKNCLRVVSAGKQIHVYQALPNTLNSLKEIVVQLPLDLRPCMSRKAISLNVIDTP